MKDKKETNVLKDAAKSFVKGVTFNSVFDSDMSEENVLSISSSSTFAYAKSVYMGNLFNCAIQLLKKTPISSSWPSYSTI